MLTDTHTIPMSAEELQKIQGVVVAENIDKQIANQLIEDFCTAHDLSLNYQKWTGRHVTRRFEKKASFFPAMLILWCILSVIVGQWNFGSTSLNFGVQLVLTTSVAIIAASLYWFLLSRSGFSHKELHQVAMESIYSARQDVVNDE